MSDECGDKHMKLAAVIISVVLLVLSAAFGYSLKSDSELDSRLRTAEQKIATVMTKLESLEKGQDQVLSKLDIVTEKIQMLSVKIGK